MAWVDPRQRRRGHLARERVAAVHGAREDADRARGIGRHRQVRGRRRDAHQLVRVTQRHFDQCAGRLVARVSIERAGRAPQRARGGPGLATGGAWPGSGREAHTGDALEGLGLKARRARRETRKPQLAQIARRNRLKRPGRGGTKRPAGRFRPSADGRGVAAQVCADQQQRGRLRANVVRFPEISERRRPGDRP
jgi:hypothetical protein